MKPVLEVSNYVAALEHGLRRLKEGFPLSNRLLREIHGVLLSQGRGSARETSGPFEFQRGADALPSARVPSLPELDWRLPPNAKGNAAFVPTPYRAVPDCMAELERFLHTREDGLPLLCTLCASFVTAIRPGSRL